MGPGFPGIRLVDPNSRTRGHQGQNNGIALHIPARWNPPQKHSRAGCIDWGTLSWESAIVLKYVRGRQYILQYFVKFPAKPEHAGFDSGFVDGNGHFSATGPSRCLPPGKAHADRYVKAIA
jgi:hypothetical protein